MESKNVRVVELRDLNLAAFLICKGFRLLEPPTPVDQKYRRFKFEKTPAFEKALLDYFNRNALVDAVTFGEAIRSLLATLGNKEGGDR